MTNALSLSSGEDIYELFFRREAHRLIALGYEKSRCKINCKLEETEITGFICEKIEEQLIIDSRLFRYSLKEDNPTQGENRTGKSRRRLDIVIQCSHSTPRQNYIFEAKRSRQLRNMTKSKFSTKNRQNYIQHWSIASDQYFSTTTQNHTPLLYIF
jgi:hypothetical protein